MKKWILGNSTGYLRKRVLGPNIDRSFLTASSYCTIIDATIITTTTTTSTITIILLILLLLLYL